MNRTYLKASRKGHGMLLGACALSLILLFACRSETKKEETPEITEVKAAIPNPFIEIVTEEMDFQMADTIPSGWNLFRYINRSPQTHFFMIDQYPEGKTTDSIVARVAPVFDQGMKLINEGKPEEGFAEFAKLPDWFAQVKFLGGSGLISPGLTTVNQLYLEPGDYIMECYVKMSNGVFHTSMGMVKSFHVSEDTLETEEIDPDIRVEISSTEGIRVLDSLSSGNKLIGVYFKDQIVHENFVGHDVNLVMLAEDTDLATLSGWMDWSSPTGLIEPAPAGMTFLGGVNNMPAGAKGYFQAQLEPGRYALVAEVPRPETKNMLVEFWIE